MITAQLLLHYLVQGLDSNEKYDRTPVIEDGGTAAEADLYLKNDQMKLCGNTECGALGFLIMIKVQFLLFKLNTQMEVLQTINYMNLPLLTQ